MTKLAWTEDCIACRLLAEFMRSSTCMTRFTPLDWWECDLCALSPAGYMTEFEIKVSRADFFMDALKTRYVWRREGKNPVYGSRAILEKSGEKQNKHQQLLSRDRQGPKQFYFVFPVGLVQEKDVPDWAGYYVVTRSERARQRPYDILLAKARQAPVLHSTPVRPIIRETIHAAGYWRYLHLKIDP